MQQISNVSKETEDKSVVISLGNSMGYFTRLRLNLGEALVTFLILGYKIFSFMQKGPSMYSQFSPRRVWDDFGRNSPHAIIPHLGID